MTRHLQAARGGTSNGAAPALPEPPEHLADPAKEIWHALAPLVPAGRLTAANADLFAMLVTHIATWREADEMIKDAGLLIAAGPDLVPSPALAIRTQADQMTARWAAIFGLTPDAKPATAQQGIRHIREA